MSCDDGHRQGHNQNALLLEYLGTKLSVRSVFSRRNVETRQEGPFFTLSIIAHIVYTLRIGTVLASLCAQGPGGERPPERPPPTSTPCQRNGSARPPVRPRADHLTPHANVPSPPHGCASPLRMAQRVQMLLAQGWHGLAWLVTRGRWCRIATPRHWRAFPF